MLNIRKCARIFVYSVLRPLRQNIECSIYSCELVYYVNRFIDTCKMSIFCTVSHHLLPFLFCARFFSVHFVYSVPFSFIIISFFLLLWQIVICISLILRISVVYFVSLTFFSTFDFPSRYAFSSATNEMLLKTFSM